jgi:outer membrane immunogenic protein
VINSKSLTLGLVAALALCVPALADGIPRGPVAGYYGPSNNWSGIYLGGQLGWMQSDINGAFEFAPVATFNPSNSAGVWGGQIGIQFQSGSIVVGVEGDFLGLMNNDFASDVCHPAISCVAGSTQHSRLDEIWTIGPRIGWAAGSWMPYATGGYASANVDNEFRTAAGAGIESTSNRHDGWYIGGGVDFAVSRNLVFGIEYRHYEFDTNSTVPVTPGGVAVPFDRWSLDATADSVTARLSYKFGREPEYRPLK